MPISPTLITIAEIELSGIVTAAGSNSKSSKSVWHFRRTATSGTLSKTVLETAFNNSVAAAVIAALNNRYTQNFTSVRWVNDAFDQPVPVTRAGVGAIAGDTMPTTEMAFLLYRTGLRGGIHKGGKKLFPFSESDTTAGSGDTWNAGCLTRLAAINTAFLAGFTDANSNVWVPCILSRKMSQLANNPTIVYTTDVTTTLVNKRVGSMRSRKVLSVY